MTITLSQQLAPYSIQNAYGIDRWKDVEGKTFSDEAGTTPVSAAQATYGGGSEFTQQNLVVGFWSGDGAGSFGAMLRPSYTFQTPIALLPGIPGAAVAAPAVNARTTASFGLTPQDNAGPALTGSVVGIVNPPEEYKELLAGAIETPDNDWQNIQYNKGVFDTLVWNISLVNRAPVLAVQGAASAAQQATVVSQVVSAFDIIVLKQIAAYPVNFLLKTNGADGETPTFWDTSTPQKLKEVLDNKDYYLMWATSWDYAAVDATIGYSFILEWPPSATR